MIEWINQLVNESINYTFPAVSSVRVGLQYTECSPFAPLVAILGRKEHPVEYDTTPPPYLVSVATMTPNPTSWFGYTLLARVVLIALLAAVL